VAYDAANKALFVTNINSADQSSNSMGYISKANLDGSIEIVVRDLFDASRQWPEMPIVLPAEVMLYIPAEAWKPRAEWTVNVSPISSKSVPRKGIAATDSSVGVNLYQLVAYGKVFAFA